MPINRRSRSMASACSTGSPFTFSLWFCPLLMYDSCTGLTGQQLRQFFRPAYNNFPYAAAQGCKGIVQFGYHACKDQLLVFQFLVIDGTDPVDDSRVIFRIQQHAAFFKGIDQADIESSAEAPRKFLGYRVGIGIEQLPLAVV